MTASTPALNPDDFLDAVKLYLSHLRDEILQAQQTRMQVHSAKIIFLGGLYTYLLQQRASLLVLVVPFVAFAFDCVIYGFTYNIYELGAYIRDNLEPVLPQPPVALLESVGMRPPFVYWETAKSRLVEQNWGRAFSRIGNYGVTILACGIAFLITWNRVPRVTWALLVALSIFSYALLMIFEVQGRRLPGMKFRSHSS
jgi:uncharacterized membrane protein YbhN (UPF0104 family)